jgi:EmrB/QacA subfamily drug resistance transporter
MSKKHLVLTAMIFAVSMMFIDQTIVALAIPSLNHDLHLSGTGSQWVINGYLLSLAALFALGGRIGDVFGHRRTLIAGVTGFALFSALCGATPIGSAGEAWIIACRVLQGACAAFLYPSALAIVISSYKVEERGKYLAIFISISGALTAIGPIAGGYLTDWTWRSIFWINVPVALIAVALTLISKPEQKPRREPIDWFGAGLSAAGMGLTVLGLQQASVWGWSSPLTLLCLIAGITVVGFFIRWELRADHPLVPLRLFKNRAFAMDNVVLLLLSVCFVPVFFFASMYAQISLGESATNAGLLLLVFFGGFALAAQKGGRIVDQRGPRASIVLGCAASAVGFYLWADSLHTLSFSSQWVYLAIAGGGMGLTLGPASTDALNRSSSNAYGAVTGVTQTVRNFGSSLGMAVLGSILVSKVVTNVESTLTRQGLPHGTATKIAHQVSGANINSSVSTSGTGHASQALIHAVQLDFASATRTVGMGMAAVMVCAFVIALLWMPRGRATDVTSAELDLPIEFEFPADLQAGQTEPDDSQLPAAHLVR